MEMPVMLKVKELSEIMQVTAPAVTQKLKSVETEELKKSEKNRTLGISRETVATILKNSGHEHFYKKNIIMSHTIVGGSMKTTAIWSLFNSYIRISSKQDPIIIISTDSQSSIDEICMQKIENEIPVLADYFNNACSIEDLIHPIDIRENLWIIRSNLNNVFLDKSLSSPTKIKSEAMRLITEIYKKFEGTNPTIFIDTMPALSTSSTSFILAMSQLKQKYQEEINTTVIIPLRTDSTSLKGAEIAYNELEDCLETFGLKSKPNIKVYLANFDKRMSVSSQIMKDLFSHPKLKNYVADTVIRTSSEITKRSYNHESVFHKNLTPVSEDYKELMLEILGYEKEGAEA